MKRLTLLLLPVLIIAGFACSSPVAFAANDTQTAVCEGIGIADPSGNCTEPAGTGSVESIISSVISILSYIVGVASVIMVMVGGFKYITANGDSSAISSAKNTIMYALIGLVVAALAQTLVIFVFDEATSPPATSVSGNAACSKPPC